MADTLAPQTNQYQYQYQYPTPVCDPTAERAQDEGAANAARVLVTLLWPPLAPAHRPKAPALSMNDAAAKGRFGLLALHGHHNPPRPAPLALTPGP